MPDYLAFGTAAARHGDALAEHHRPRSPRSGLFGGTFERYPSGS
jgi:hypothetical protein